MKEPISKGRDFQASGMPTGSGGLCRRAGTHGLEVVQGVVKIADETHDGQLVGQSLHLHHLSHTHTRRHRSAPVVVNGTRAHAHAQTHTHTKTQVSIGSGQWNMHTHTHSHTHIHTEEILSTTVEKRKKKHPNIRHSKTTSTSPLETNAGLTEVSRALASSPPCYCCFQGRQFTVL